jgi:hypothetical protein
MPNSPPDYNLFQCNPSTLQSTRTTCLPQDMILRIRDAWNERFPNHAIPVTLRKKEEIWSAIKKRLHHQYECASEYCAVQKLGSTTDKQAATGYFRPSKPTEWSGAKKPEDQWHDNSTIERVMNQYEAANPHFEFIGPVPIDFDAKLPGGWGRCVVDELCSLDLEKQRKRGTKAIGVVFNLDPHDKPGSHWVCAYIDLAAGTAYYYDSYGLPPCSEIRRFLRRCRDQGCRQIVWNDVRHQRKQSECGTYCMYIIIMLLKGHPFDRLCKNRIDDDTMNAFRDVLYATETPRPAAVNTVVKLLDL